MYDLNPRNRPRGAYRRPSGVVLLATHDDVLAATVADLLEPDGYVLFRVSSGRDALRQAPETDPDAILIDATLPDLAGVEVCRALRAHPAVAPSSALMMLMAGAPTPSELADALRAGVWDCLGRPVDGDYLLLKLDVYVRARMDAEHARGTGLLDPTTGLYNRQGLARRARELGAQAFRQHTALACVVVTLEPRKEELASDHGDSVSGAVERFAAVLREEGRLSDAIGRLGPTEFAVLAPATDARGAAAIAGRLARGFQRVAQDAGVPGATLRIRAGYDAVPNLTYAPADPVELLAHAMMAARHAKPTTESGWINQFDPSTLS